MDPYSSTVDDSGFYPWALYCVRGSCTRRVYPVKPTTGIEHHPPAASKGSHQSTNQMERSMKRRAPSCCKKIETRAAATTTAVAYTSYSICSAGAPRQKTTTIKKSAAHCCCCCGSTKGPQGGLGIVDTLPDFLGARTLRAQRCRPPPTAFVLSALDPRTRPTTAVFVKESAHPAFSDRRGRPGKTGVTWPYGVEGGEGGADR